jgi:hypothetical protein
VFSIPVYISAVNSISSSFHLSKRVYEYYTPIWSFVNVIEPLLPFVSIKK